jgi:hypothetical protein
MDIRRWAYVPLLIAAIAGVWLAADGRLHADEPSYLYAGHYLSAGQVVAGEVQPSGIPGFTQGRILHALIVKGVMAPFDSGESGFKAMILLHFLLTTTGLVLVARILRDLLPDAGTVGTSVALLAMSPIVLFMVLKTLGDNESLLAALVATIALYRGAKAGSMGLAILAAAALAVSALSKNQMIIMPAGFWAAMCIAPFSGIDRRRFAIYGASCGAGGLLLTVIALEVLDIGLSGYLSSYGDAFVSSVPLIAKVVNFGTEFGLLWILVPFAALSSRRAPLFAFSLWFLFTTIPVILLFPSIEARHLAGNLVATGGLLVLALEAIVKRTATWGRMGSVGKSIAAASGVAILMASNFLVLAISPHRVDLKQLDRMIASLDERYGAGRYAMFTARGYTDFHIIRLLWPAVDVRHAGASAMAVHAKSGSRDSALDAYMGQRHPDSIEELASLDRPLVYMGYQRTFAADNLRTLLNSASRGLGDRLVGRVELVDHMYPPETQWLWDDPNVRLRPVSQIGHYLAFEIMFSTQGTGIDEALIP